MRLPDETGANRGGETPADADPEVPAVVSAPTDPLAALNSPAGVALILATTLASTVGFFDANVVNVAVPAISLDLNASIASLQWVLTGYLLAVAGLLLVAGALADRFGRRRILIIGLLVMLGASVPCALAPSSGALIAARVVQGVGGALVVPSSLALLNGTLRVTDRARGIGIWAGLATLGTTVGPFVGGWLVDHASWRWLFVANAPLILGALLALTRVPESTDARRALSPDVLGGLLAILGLGGVIYALTDGAAHGWTSARVILALVIGLGSLAALVPVERRLSSPMLRLSLFGSRQFDAINVTTVLFYGSLAASGYLLVLQCELQLGFSPTEAGAALIPGSVVFLALSPISGALVARVGPRRLMATGILIVAASLGWLSAAQAGASYVSAILPGALLWGLGLGLAVTPLTAAVLAAVSDADLGEASAINDAASRLGGVIAIAAVPALVGATADTSLTDALAGGYQTAMIVVAGACVVAAAVTARFVSDVPAAAPSFAPPLHGCVPANLNRPQPQPLEAS
jgi:EmrB/QacA subfamily drug resistance transporter